MRMFRIKLHRFVFLMTLLVLTTSVVLAGRVTMSLNGTWEIGESVGPEEKPVARYRG